MHLKDMQIKVFLVNPPKNKRKWFIIDDINDVSYDDDKISKEKETWLKKV